MEQELDDEIYDRVTHLSDEGNNAFEENDFATAIKRYDEAVKLLPLPVAQWDAALWLFASIGDIQYQLGQFPEAIESLRIALACADGNQNPFVQIRLGQCLYQESLLDEAANHLTIAYMLEGTEIFKDEPSHYLQFLSTRIRIEES